MMRSWNPNRCWMVVFLVVLPVVGLGAAGHAADALRLKPGAKGAVCLSCHTPFEATLKRPHTHPLVKAGDCTACHTPHTSAHGGLLVTDAARLCIDCHREVSPATARSVHSVSAEGGCLQCHDAHGSDNPFNLIKPGNELCVDCHQDVGGSAGALRFKHPPLRQDKGCLNCHDAHVSQQLPALLKASAPQLCRQCHKTAEAAFRGSHAGYDVAQSDCTSCHNPHGSNKRGLLYDVAHRPLEEKQCAACHKNPADPTVLVTGERGTGLCRQCHAEMIDASLSQNRVHWSMLNGAACLNCHNPHATKFPKLVNGPTAEVCGQCHTDTVKLQELSKKNPKNKKLCEPVKKGDCVACHTPHAAEGVLRFTAPTSIQMCGQCHEWQTHSTHPIGEKVIDPRNKNLTLDCLSCHKGCGTSNHPVMLQFETTYDLCVSCHVDRRR
jgi:predicted CXXCH cytochrome family protein